MTFLGKIFNRKPELTPCQRVRGIIKIFDNASMTGLLDPKLMEGTNHIKAYLLYMFGAVDMISQVNKLSSKETLEVFESMLQNEISNQTPDSAKGLARMVISESATQAGQTLMQEGGNALKYWIQGVTLAPHRLQEILSTIKE